MPARFRFNRVRRAIREAAAPAPPPPPNWYMEAPVNPGAPPAWPRGWQQAGRDANPAVQGQQPAPQPQMDPDIQRRLAELQAQLEVQHDEMMKKLKKPPKPVKLIRALPAGRMRSVRLGDILKAYKRTNNFHRDHYQIIDFRPVKDGEYYMETSFNIQKANGPIGRPLLVVELVKGKKQAGILDDDFAVDYDRVEERRR